MLYLLLLLLQLLLLSVRRQQSSVLMSVTSAEGAYCAAHLRLVPSLGWLTAAAAWLLRHGGSRPGSGNAGQSEVVVWRRTGFIEAVQTQVFVFFGTGQGRSQ